MKLPAVLPDGFLQAMPAEERKKMGRAGMTTEEASAKFLRGEERKLQELIVAWLRLNGFYFVRPRMDKKTTTAKGTPDFIACVDGKFLCIEAKTAYGKLSDDQLAVMVEATRSGAAYCVARSLEEVIIAVETLKATQ